MSDIKLVYFNLRGRAEAARFTLAQAGVDYEDVRVTREEWVKLKPGKKRVLPSKRKTFRHINFLEYTFGQLPGLEYKGEKIGQSMAITRFLGREFGLAGKDNWTQAKVDEVIDSVSDLINSKYREVL